MITFASLVLIASAGFGLLADMALFSVERCMDVV